jgi:hypothetical protein
MAAVAEISGYRKRAAVGSSALLPTNDAVTAVTERVFAERVEGHVFEGILRYSDRLKLLRAAERLHIERFRANLIIALVQRQSQVGRPRMRMGADSLVAARRWRVSSAVGVVLLVEIVVVATLCWAWLVF